MLDNGPHLSPWDVLSLGRFVSGTFCLWDVLSLGTFCPLGCFVLGTFCPLGRFVPGTFSPWDVLSLGRFVLGRFECASLWGQSAIFIRRGFKKWFSLVETKNVKVFAFFMVFFIRCQICIPSVCKVTTDALSLTQTHPILCFNFFIA